MKWWIRMKSYDILWNLMRCNEIRWGMRCYVIRNEMRSDEEWDEIRWRMRSDENEIIWDEEWDETKNEIHQMRSDEEWDRCRMRWDEESDEMRRRIRWDLTSFILYKISCYFMPCHVFCMLNNSEDCYIIMIMLQNVLER